MARLLEAHAQMGPYGLKLLPISDVGTRTTEDLRKHIDHTRGTDRRAQAGGLPDLFDVAISFAGTERQYAEALAQVLREAGYDVFYDDFYAAQLWGKNLYEFFHEIYSKRSRYCVIFVSKEYGERVWTNHERQSAQERMLRPNLFCKIDVNRLL